MFISPASVISRSSVVQCFHQDHDRSSGRYGSLSDPDRLYDPRDPGDIPSQLPLPMSSRDLGIEFISFFSRPLSLSLLDSRVLSQVIQSQFTGLSQSISLLSQPQLTHDHQEFGGELRILIHKQLFSPLESVRILGIIGGVALFTQIGQFPLPSMRLSSPLSCLIHLFSDDSIFPVPGVLRGQRPPTIRPEAILGRLFHRDAVPRRWPSGRRS